MFDLTPDEVADAEACGVSFPAATPAQVHRYAMQQKLFCIGGAPHLATRGDWLFETAATLKRLIAEGGRQRRALAEWAAATPVAEAPASPSLQAAAPIPSSVPAAATPEARTVRAAASRRIPRAERWLTAGAKRRGRLAEHWSRRQQG